MGDTLQHYWQQIMAVVAAVIWGARLEGRASQNSKDLANLERRLSDQRREDMEVRARDWGRMEAAIDEMRKDIKELLGRKS